MKSLQTITIKEYLTRKGIIFRESGKELTTQCLFGGCDDDSKGTEAHLYFNTETGQYDCKKCGAKGNIVTLAKHLGDTVNDIAINQSSPIKNVQKTSKFDAELVESCHLTLPANIRQYLNARGITDGLIDTYKLGWGTFYGKWWITIPINDTEGNFQFFKLRKDPNDQSNPDKYKFFPTGSEATVYGWDTLINSIETVVICEGEFDRLLLMLNGITAITSTAGAKTFKKEWVDKISVKCRNIYICFDNDKEGKEGAEKVSKLFENDRNKIFIVSLPNEVGEAGDITDYLIKLGGKTDDLFGKYARFISDFEKSGRVKKIEKLEKRVSFTEWRETIKNNFPDLIFPAEFGLAILAQILIKEITNPFSLVFVDVPSAGKTIAINFFAEIDGLTYATDKFTPASFVSNAANVAKEKLAEIDLLPRLKHKMFLIRDLSTLFSKRDEDLNECLGILTRILDGEGLNADTGVHGQRHYVGDFLFMILAGSTPIPPRVWKMMGNLGSRLFFLNMGTREKSDDELVEQITTLAYKDKEKICRIVTKDFLNTLWYEHPEGVDWNKQEDQKEYKLIIVSCARLLAKLRGVINVWKDKSQDGEVYDHTSHVIEKPDRINQLFYNLCRGHALVCGRTQINTEDLKLIIELAIDSAPTTRAKLFRKLLDYNGVMKTSDVEMALQCSKPTALKEMETLRILGVCYITQDSYGMAGEPEKTIHLFEAFKWFLTDECKSMRGIALPPKQNTLADLL
jgi:hypothetical protein